MCLQRAPKRSAFFLAMSVDLGKIESIANRILPAHHAELVDLEFQREPNGWVLRLFIDRVDPSGAPTGVTLDLCEAVSRDLSAALDVDDVIEQRYHLEVSSPGLDRRLRRREHFDRYVGREARLTARNGIEGRRNFRGTIAATDDETVTLEVDGRTYRIPFADVARANLIFDETREP